MCLLLLRELTLNALQDEVREVLLQASIYCGMPAGLEGFRVAQRVLDASKEEESSK